MNFIQSEQIELAASEINALAIVLRISERIANGAHDPEHREKGKAIFEACASLEFTRSNEEDPNEAVLFRNDLRRISEGDWSIEDLKRKLPSECADLINRTISDVCDDAAQHGYEEGYSDGYADGYDDLAEIDREDE